MEFLDGLILRKPAKLRAGDRIAAVTLSWGAAGEIPHRYEVGRSRLQSQFDLEVIPTTYSLMSAEWIAENPEARANDLMDAFRDPHIKAIICNIGGDDSIRLLPYIDYAVIRDNPKIFMGCSDNTVTHFMCLRAGLSSIYGPSVFTSFSENVAMHEHTVEGVKKTLFRPVDPIGLIPESIPGWTAEYLEWSDVDNQNIQRRLQPHDPWRYIGDTEKTVQGRLIGGCVEVLQWLTGTELWPPLHVWENAICFLETSEEGVTPKFVKRFLRCLAAQGILPKLSGILFAKPGGHQTSENFESYDRVFTEVFLEYRLPLIPIVCGMDFGHTEPFWPLPYGCLAEISPVNRTVTILESAVLEPDEQSGYE